MVRLINESNLNDQELAHFNLLKVQTAYLVNKPLVSSDSLLDTAIAYYQQISDSEKLADAYYYKAIGMNLEKNFDRSIIMYKKAELLAQRSGNKRQQYKIAEGIAFVNGHSANYNLQLDYAKKLIKLAKEIGNKQWIAYSYYWLGYAHSCLNHEDSVLYYFAQLPNYIKYVNGKDKPVFLSSIGYLLRDKHPEEAKKYLKKSLSYKESTNVYEYLAEIYYDEGNQIEAYNLWNKALTVNDAITKDDVIRNLIEYDIERGKIDSISSRVTEIIAIRDSIDAIFMNDSIKDIQSRFEQEVALREKDQIIIQSQWAILALVVVLLGFIGYYLRKKHLAKIRLQGYQMEIQDYQSQIEALKASGAANDQKIEKLNKSISDILKNKAQHLDEGGILYNKVVKGEQMGKWETAEIRKFLDYYNAINYRVMRQLKNVPRAGKLTDHRLFYLTLKEMGKSDNDILWIMSISKETLRVYRNRTKPL